MSADDGHPADLDRCMSALQSALTLQEVGAAFPRTAAAVLDADVIGLYRFDAVGAPLSEVLSDAEGTFLQNCEDYGRAAFVSIFLAICGPLVGGWIAGSSPGYQVNFYAFAAVAVVGCLAVGAVRKL